MPSTLDPDDLGRSRAVVSPPLRHRPLPAAVALAAMLAAGLPGGCATTIAPAPAALPPSGVPTYELTTAERSWPCGALKSAVMDSIGRMRTLKANVAAEQQAVSPTLALSLTRVFGSPDAPPTEARDALLREKAMATAYNSALHDRGCAAIDLDNPAIERVERGVTK